MAPFEMRCIACGKEHDMAAALYACSSCGNLLEAVMDVPSAQQRLSSSDWRSRPLSVWKYRELMPFGPGIRIFTRGEGGTPLIECERLAAHLDLDKLWIKFDGVNPTGSFKDRGMTAGIAKAKELDMKIVTCASTGNTSASLAAYAGLAGLKCVVLIPEGKVALGKLAQAMMHGAKVVSVRGNFDQALSMVMEASSSLGMYVLNSVNPFRIEGQKTAAYEICDQMGGQSPDTLYIPVGNGGNSSAYWKGFKEYLELGIVDSHPRIMGIQAEGAAPVASMFSSGAKEIVPVEMPDTVATAIRIGNPANWKKTVRAIKDSGGTCSTVTDDDILSAQRLMAQLEGIFPEPAGAAAVAGLAKDVRNGVVDRSSRIVCVSTGHGLKDPDIAVRQSEKPVAVDATIEALREIVEGL